MPRITSRNSDFPRAFDDHRTAEGRHYGDYCRALLARLGPLPAAASATLREAGKLVVDLDAIGRELDRARKRRQRKDMARLRRQMTPMRTQLLTLERRLEELAADRPRTPMAAIADLPVLES